MKVHVLHQLFNTLLKVEDHKKLVYKETLQKLHKNRSAKRVENFKNIHPTGLTNIWACPGFNHPYKGAHKNNSYLFSPTYRRTN